MLRFDSRLSVSILAVMIGVYCVITVPEVFTINDYPDSNLIRPQVKAWSITSPENVVRLTLLKIGAETGIMKLVPFVESVGVLVMTYLLSVQLSNRMGGLVATVIVASSNLFRFFDTSIAYDNSWTLFLLMAVYFSNRWYLGGLLFVASALCKSLTLVFSPSMLFMSIRKENLGIVYIVSILFGGAAVLSVSTGFSYSGFISGLTDWWYFMFSDIYMTFAIPFVMFLLVLFRKRMKNTMIPFAFMLNAILSGVIVEGFTALNNEPYRYVPLVVFFAIGVSTLLQSYVKLNSKNTVISLDSKKKQIG